VPSSLDLVKIIFFQVQVYKLLKCAISWQVTRQMQIQDTPHTPSFSGNHHLCGKFSPKNVAVRVGNTHCDIGKNIEHHLDNALQPSAGDLLVQIIHSEYNSCPPCQPSSFPPPRLRPPCLTPPSTCPSSLLPELTTSSSSHNLQAKCPTYYPNQNPTPLSC